MYEEQFGTRFIVECCEFQLRLQANLAEEGKPRLLNNVSGPMRHSSDPKLGMPDPKLGATDLKFGEPDPNLG